MCPSVGICLSPSRVKVSFSLAEKGLCMRTSEGLLLKQESAQHQASLTLFRWLKGYDDHSRTVWRSSWACFSRAASAGLAK